MEGNAAHRRLILLLLAAVARREGEIQLSGRKLRVLVKHFIEIAQTEKQQAVGIARLDLAVLLHHGRQFSHFLTLFHGFAPEWHCFFAGAARSVCMRRRRGMPPAAYFFLACQKKVCKKETPENEIALTRRKGISILRAIHR